MHRFALVCSVLLCAVPVRAAPLLLEQGAASTGLAGSGTARVTGPASLFHNPAAAADVAGISVEIGGAAVLAHHQVHRRDESMRERLLGYRSTGFQPATPPAVFATARMRDLALGVGVYSPMVLSLRWPGGWEGRGEAVLVDVKPVTVNPVLAYRISRIRFGMGMTFTGAYAEQERVISSSGAERTMRTDGLGAGIGFTAGIMIVPTDRLRVGVNYRSRTLLGFRERVRFSGGDALAACDGASLCLKDQMAFADMTLPDVASVGLAWRALPATEVSIDGNMVLWSVDGRGGRVFENASTRVPARKRLFRDAMAMRIALEQGLFFLAPDVKVRGGLVVEGSPMNTSDATADAPWSERLGASVGLGWRIFGVTLAAAYLGDVTVPRAGTLAGERVDYRSTTHMLSVSVGYQHVP